MKIWVVEYRPRSRRDWLWVPSSEICYTRWQARQQARRERARCAWMDYRVRAYQRVEGSK